MLEKSKTNITSEKYVNEGLIKTGRGRGIECNSSLEKMLFMNYTKKNCSGWDKQNFFSLQIVLMPTFRSTVLLLLQGCKSQ